MSANSEITSLCSCLCQGCEEATILSHLRCRDEVLLMGESLAHLHLLEKVLLTQSQLHFFPFLLGFFVVLFFFNLGGLTGGTCAAEWLRQGPSTGSSSCHDTEMASAETTVVYFE